MQHGFDVDRPAPAAEVRSWSMRIGVLASIAHRTPPRSYGPWEQVASTLAEGLVRRGHDVTLFATADSVTTAHLHAVAPTGYEEDRALDAKVVEALHIAAAFERAADFDVLSNQFDFLPLTYSRLVATPVVTTVHGFSSERIVPVYAAYDDIAHYVSISDADRHPDLTYTATIHQRRRQPEPGGGVDARAAGHRAAGSRTGPAGVTDTLVTRHTAELRPDPARVVARLFLPGEELRGRRSRAGSVVAGILALDEAEVERLAQGVLGDFGTRHAGLPQLLDEHAAAVRSHVRRGVRLTAARRTLIGACFTAEYAVEAAAVCNPSAVLHPDQTGVAPGQARLAVSLRGIGEGHISSIGFCSAVVGDGRWTFEPRPRPIVAGTTEGGAWRREHLRAVLDDHRQVDGLAHSVLGSLPETFSSGDLQDAIDDVHPDLTARPGAQQTVDLLRQLVASAYRVTFPQDVDLGQQVLLPSAVEERNGMEDARFVRFVDDDGQAHYRATYTAYDGARIAPRLLTSPDLRTFQAHRLAGPAARNKGIALFPRPVAGRHLAVCRVDGETMSIARSRDGLRWGRPEPLPRPQAAWEILQTGNCGSPLETPEGWLLLTHGVGPMRTYSIGALLLDLEDPVRVLRVLDQPLLRPTAAEQDGYVPNVVYSCGGALHDGTVWIPYGVGDARIRVASVPLETLLARMRRVG
jgi:predicted GH43/DUF377 family glycosyl hydrolase